MKKDLLLDWIDENSHHCSDMSGIIAVSRSQLVAFIESLPQEQSNSEWVSVDIKPNFGIYEVYIDPKCSSGFNAIAIYDGEWLVEGYENSNARDFITHYKNRTQPPK